MVMECIVLAAIALQLVLIVAKLEPHVDLHARLLPVVSYEATTLQFIKTCPLTLAFLPR